MRKPTPKNDSHGPTAAPSANGTTPPRDSEPPDLAEASTADEEAIRRFALPQNYAEAVATTKLTTVVPIRKPGKFEFVRAHPTHAFDVFALRLKQEARDETYLVEPELQPALSQDLVPLRLHLACSRDSAVFLWPIRLPGADGRTDRWSESAHAAAQAAMARWIRLVPDLHAGAYTVLAASGIFDDPSWPNTPFSRLIEVAFRDRIIAAWDHPMLRRLRGEL